MIIRALLVLMCTFALTACKNSEPDELDEDKTTGEEVEENVDEAADDTADAVDEAGEEVEDAVE